MGHVCREVAALTFRFLQPLGHDVEAMGQFLYLCGASGISSLRQIPPPQPTGRCAQALQRRQRPPREKPHQQRPQGSRAYSGPQQGAVDHGRNAGSHRVGQERTFRTRVGEVRAGNRKGAYLLTVLENRKLFQVMLARRPAFFVLVARSSHKMGMGIGNKNAARVVDPDAGA